MGYAMNSDNYGKRTWRVADKTGCYCDKTGGGIIYFCRIQLDLEPTPCAVRETHDGINLSAIIVLIVAQFRMETFGVYLNIPKCKRFKEESERPHVPHKCLRRSIQKRRGKRWIAETMFRRLLYPLRRSQEWRERCNIICEEKPPECIQIRRDCMYPKR